MCPYGERGGHSDTKKAVGDGAVTGSSERGAGWFFPESLWKEPILLIPSSQTSVFLNK